MPKWLVQAAGKLCALIDKALRGDERARIWFHQAAIDAIASQPIPYTLAPLAESLLSDPDPGSPPPSRGQSPLRLHA